MFHFRSGYTCSVFPNTIILQECQLRNYCFRQFFQSFFSKPVTHFPSLIHKFQCRSLLTFSGVKEGFRTQPRLYYLLKWSLDYLLNETLMGCHCPLCHQKYKVSWHTAESHCYISSVKWPAAIIKHH